MSYPWEPLPDPDKPDCPYLPGFEVDIRSHVAPPPFGNRLYPSKPRPPITDEWLRSATQTKQVLAYPPLETPPPVQSETARLTITKILASGDSRGAQVLLCSIRKPNAEPFTAVAKIFDPLYYPSATEIACSPIAVVDHADGHYSREAAAYEFLRSIGQTGSFAPEYFGSWTFSLPISFEGQERQRSIRLVLIEYLAGACLQDLFVENGHGHLDASHISVQYRLRTLAMLLGGIARQHHAGLSQSDLAPRNVIILPHPNEVLDDTGPTRVVLIDYAMSLIFELSTYGKLPFQLAKLPQNPMQLFWKDSLIDFGSWTPPGWHQNPRLRQEWLVREFGGDKAVLYEPVDEQLPMDHKSISTSSTANAQPNANGAQRTTAADPLTGRSGSGHGNIGNSGPSHGRAPAASKSSTYGGAQPQRPTSVHRPNPAPAANNAPGSSAEVSKKKRPFQVAQAPLTTQDDKPSHQPGLWYEAVQNAIKAGKTSGN